MNGDAALPNVITFPPSSDSEAGRWALNHYGIPFREKPNAPPFFLLAVFLHGGKKFPLFLGQGVKLNGAREIVDHFEALAPPERKLIPDDKKAEIDRAWQVYQEEMDEATVQWAYFHFLPHRDIMVRPLSLGTPWYQRLTVKYLYPLPKKFLWNTLKLNQASADSALALIRRTFEQVSVLLKDGRPYLTGDTFTLADLSFAVSGAPLVLADGYGGYRNEQGPVPSFEESPPEVQAVVKEMRETEAGKFVERMYREERYRQMAG